MLLSRDSLQGAPCREVEVHYASNNGIQLHSEKHICNRFGDNAEMGNKRHKIGNPILHGDLSFPCH